MTEPDIVKSLEALGFNLNEGRGYAALLSRGPSTGYEVSQHAGIPRSAVYSVLRKLVAEGAARRTPGPPERFTATPPETLLAQLQKRFDNTSKALRDAVARLDIASSTPDAYSVEGYARILEEATNLVRGAERLLVVSGWPRELSQMLTELSAAAARGVYVVVFSHAALPQGLSGARFSYGLDEADLEAFWRHRLVIVADDRKSLLGATERRADDRAVVSSTVAIAEVAVSQIALDITLLAQRHHADVGDVLAKILGDRVGRLDSVLPRGGEAELGRGVAEPAGRPSRGEASGGKRRPAASGGGKAAGRPRSRSSRRS